MTVVPPQTLYLTLADGTIVPLAVGGTDTLGDHPSANPAFHVVPQWTLRDRKLALTLKPLAERPPLPPQGIAVRSERLHGLTPGRTYHCRLRATSRQGTTLGTDRMFVAG